MDIDRNALHRAIVCYGPLTESIAAIEELGELIQCITKELKGEHDYEHLAEEIADANIVIESIKMIYGVKEGDIQLWINHKQARLRERMEKDAEENCAEFLEELRREKSYDGMDI